MILGIRACIPLSTTTPRTRQAHRTTEPWIEGTCRHLIGDRLDITGARWGLEGAEAVLKLRALWSNGDLDAYWRFHRAQEHRRIHHPRYQHPPALAA
jgi:hypothetical protein